MLTPLLFPFMDPAFVPHWLPRALESDVAVHLLVPDGVEPSLAAPSGYVWSVPAGLPMDARTASGALAQVQALGQNVRHPHDVASLAHTHSGVQGGQDPEATHVLTTELNRRLRADGAVDAQTTDDRDHAAQLALLLARQLEAQTLELAGAEDRSALSWRELHEVMGVDVNDEEAQTESTVATARFGEESPYEAWSRVAPQTLVLLEAYDRLADPALDLLVVHEDIASRLVEAGLEFAAPGALPPGLDEQGIARHGLHVVEAHLPASGRRVLSLTEQNVLPAGGA